MTELPASRRSARRLLLARAVTAATTATLVPVIAGHHSAEAEVRLAIDRFFDAARERNWDAAGKMMAADFHLWLGVDESFDRTAYIELMKSDDLNVVSLSLQDLEIGVSADESFAWARYHASVDGISKGQRSLLRTAETIVFGRRRGESWLMRHIHVSLRTAE